MGFWTGLLVGWMLGSGSEGIFSGNSHKTAMAIQIADFEQSENELYISACVGQAKERKLKEIRKRYWNRPELEAALLIHKDQWPEEARQIEERLWEWINELQDS